MDDAPRHLTDVSVAAWIAPRLAPFGGRVGSVVPRGYAAYARVLHPPATDPPTTWAQTCAATGAQAHALMQWGAVIGRAVEPPPHAPDVGSLDAAPLRTLRDVLENRTAPGQDWFLAVWDGWGWVHGNGWRQTITADGVVTTPLPPAFGAEVRDGPKLHLPHREYLLFAGPPSAVTRLGDPGGAWSQSPSLFWPADRSWCVATEIDFDSTLVAGHRDLVAAVLAEPGLEAWPVEPDDSLAADGDTING